MNTSDSANAIRKFCAARPSSRDRPANRRAVARAHVQRIRRLRHRVHRGRLRDARQQAREDRHLPLTVQPVDVARRRARREVRDVLERHAADRRRGHGQLPDGRRRRALLDRARGRALRTARPPSLYVVTWSPPTSSRSASAASAICTPRSAAFSRSSCTESSGLPTFSDVSTSTTPAAPARAAATLSAYCSQPAEIRTVDRELDLGVLVAAAADRRDRPDAGPQVAPPRTAAARRRARRSSPRTGRACALSSGFSRT